MRQDRTGYKFGTLTVVALSPKSTTKRSVWRCVCTCGAMSEVRTDTFDKQKSCRNCSHTKHGHWKGNISSRTHEAWRSMKKRCSVSGNASFQTHGARGITVCDRWKNSFENFLADMGECPPGLTLDRYPDNDGPYEPENCRWATWKDQARNRRNNHFVEFDGLNLTIGEWSERTGFSDSVIHARLDRGWTIREALTTTPGTRGRWS